MSIKSLVFIAFVLAVIVVYYFMAKTNKQKYVILVAGLICMISMSSVWATTLVILLAFVVFAVANKMEVLIQKNGGKVSKAVRYWFWFGVVADIGLLLYFKFFKGTYYLLQSFLATKSISLIDLVVPVGLAYYSLALYGYLSDVYHKKYGAEKNFLLFLTYVTYFPAIVEGPISFYKRLAPQIQVPHAFNESRVVMGAQRTLWGYFKKVVIADRIGILVSGILQDEAAVGMLIFYAIVLYSFQIYTDFSGGIDVIMGISEMLDIELAENFRSPLVAANITEYWQRWHMSLGEFMEKYLYYPIVLNRNIMKFSKKIPNKYLSRAFSATLASIIVFIVVGIWHGTGWNYVVYGMYQAFFVSSAVLLAPTYKKVKTFLHVNEKDFGWKLFTIIRTFVILVFGRMLIRAADLSQAIDMFKKMFSDARWSALFDGTVLNYGLDIKNIYLMYLCILLIIVVDVCHEKGIHFRQWLMQQSVVFRYVVYYTAVFAIIVFGIYGPQFSSASFIYQAF